MSKIEINITGGDVKVELNIKGETPELTITSAEDKEAQGNGMTLSDLINEYTKINHLCLREFARRCGISHGTAAILAKDFNAQTGRRQVPTIGVLAQISKGMGLSLDELLTTVDDLTIYI